MARHNHIYDFDYLQNVTFPANLTASNINATNINATNINASNIYATNFEGTASKVNIKQNTSANSTYYLMLTNKNAGSTYTYVNSNLLFNPSTGTLTNKISTFNFNKSGDVPVFYPNKWLRIIKITIPSSYNWLDETIEIPVKFRWVSSLIYIDVHFYTYGDKQAYIEPIGPDFFCHMVGKVTENSTGILSISQNSVTHSLYNIKKLFTFNNRTQELVLNNSAYNKEKIFYGRWGSHLNESDGNWTAWKDTSIFKNPYA